MIKLILGDITKIQTQAIVNAGKPSLLGGGGVDGAIHAAAGPELLAECRTLGGVNTGEVKTTKGYRLPAKYVIHTAGPVYCGGKKGEAELLTNCYKNALKEALNLKVSSIAFPCISTGVYGYPQTEAAQIAIAAARDFLLGNEIEINFVCYLESDYKIYKKLLGL